MPLSGGGALPRQPASRWRYSRTKFLARPMRARLSERVRAGFTNNYLLRITLAEIEPSIWRRVIVPGNITLANLHQVIQIAMGWDNYHLYLFTQGRQRYGEGAGEWSEYGQHVISTKRVSLGELVSRRGAKLQYMYDMGDGWGHEIQVEEIHEGPAAKIQCLAGEHNCPPEDCGGPTGYQEMLEIIFDPQHPDHDDRMEWLGGGFQPESFDMAAVNRRLGRLKVKAEAP